LSAKLCRIAGWTDKASVFWAADEGTENPIKSLFAHLYDR